MTVTEIGYDAFGRTFALTEITFGGTIAQWRAIKKADGWQSNMNDNIRVVCMDGTVDIYGKPLK